MGRMPSSDRGSYFRARFIGGRQSAPIFYIEAWMSSEVNAISPLVDRMMRLIEGVRCIAGEEANVELALREALSNAVIHGNKTDAHKLVRIRCRCQLRSGISIVVSDQGQGFDPDAVPDPRALENVEADHGRGIYLMKLAMDEITFEGIGNVVRMRKVSAYAQGTGMRNKDETALPNTARRGDGIPGARGNEVARKGR